MRVSRWFSGRRRLATDPLIRDVNEIIERRDPAIRNDTAGAPIGKLSVRKRVGSRVPRREPWQESAVEYLHVSVAVDDNVASLVIARRPGTNGGPFDRTGEKTSWGDGQCRGSQWTSSGPSDIEEVNSSRHSLP